MLTIRPEGLIEDEPGIRAVLLAAFPTNAEAHLVDRLRTNGHNIISLVAELDGVVVGSILFSPVIAGSSRGLGLAPLAVLPKHQRQGIGSALVREGLALCKGKGCEFVVVLGHLDFYRRFGFQPASQSGIQNEFGASDSFMFKYMRLDLPFMGTIVRYGLEFAEWKVT
ncbi:MAG TPA: N-acetyltransferase [Gemmataceae bacterium]|jgi:putative acetyltransferase|nr:N-acetyltransferase [Gemmataceae bacterium]